MREMSYFASEVVSDALAERSNYDFLGFKNYHN